MVSPCPRTYTSHELVDEGGRLYRPATFHPLEDYRAWTRNNPGKTK